LRSIDLLVLRNPSHGAVFLVVHLPEDHGSRRHAAPFALSPQRAQANAHHLEFTIEEVVSFSGKTIPSVGLAKPALSKIMAESWLIDREG
jgi:hypothetical protein